MLLSYFMYILFRGKSNIASICVFRDWQKGYLFKLAKIPLQRGVRCAWLTKVMTWPRQHTVGPTSTCRLLCAGMAYLLPWSYTTYSGYRLRIGVHWSQFQTVETLWGQISISVVPYSTVILDKTNLVGNSNTTAVSTPLRRAAAVHWRVDPSMDGWMDDTMGRSEPSNPCS